MKKPYLLIAGDYYYPSADTGDWIGCFETYEDAKAPGKFIKPYALQEGDKFRLPNKKLLDKHFRCWWWNSIDKYWKYEFRIMIGDSALDENDYIIGPYEKSGFDTDTQSWKYRNDDALRLIGKGITHFIPYIEDCSLLILCDPLNFDELTKDHLKNRHMGT